MGGTSVQLFGGKMSLTRGVANGLLAYVAKTAKGDYKPFCFNQALMTTHIDFSDEMFRITKETAEAYLKAKAALRELGLSDDITSD
jgi:hypothetical protein